MGSKSKNKSTGTNAAQLSTLMQNNPMQQFSQVFGNQQQLQNSQLGAALPIFGAMMQQGQQTMDNNPMFGVMRQMGLMPEQPQVAQQPEPELSPYEQRLQVLMNDKGMSREDAIANQQNAMRLGTDYNNDGAVTNDEWAKFQQTPDGMAYENRGTAPQPQIVPRTQTVPPGMGFYGNPMARGGRR